MNEGSIRSKKGRVPRFKVRLLEGKCIACGGRCEAECPSDAIQMNDRGEPIIDLEKCIGCLKCLKVCPAAALEKIAAAAEQPAGPGKQEEEKSYEMNVRGFLVNPSEWDEEFALYKAYEMKMPKLTDKHWQIISFLRQSFEKNRSVPTVYETCEANGIDLEELCSLFPDGYHRGAVKIAGLKVR